MKRLLFSVFICGALALSALASAPVEGEVPPAPKSLGTSVPDEFINICEWLTLSDIIAFSLTNKALAEYLMSAEIRPLITQPFLTRLKAQIGAAPKQRQVFEVWQDFVCAPPLKPQRVLLAQRALQADNMARLLRDTGAGTLLSFLTVGQSMGAPNTTLWLAAHANDIFTNQMVGFQNILVIGAALSSPLPPHKIVLVMKRIVSHFTKEMSGSDQAEFITFMLTPKVIFDRGEKHYLLGDEILE